MYIGPWQELRLGQLLNEHKRLMEQSVHQQLQIIKQQQLIQAMQDQQQQQQPPLAQPLSPRAALLHTRQLPLSSLPSVLSAQSPRSHFPSHSHHSSYAPSLVRELSTASTLSSASSITAAPSSLVHYHHSNDPYPLPPLPPLARASPPSTRRRLGLGPAEGGEQSQRRKKSARATKEQVAADRLEQLERMRAMYGLNGSKQAEEHKEQEQEVAVEPYVESQTPIFPHQRVPISLPRPQRIAAAEVLVLADGEDEKQEEEKQQSDAIHLPDAIADYLMSAATQPKQSRTTTGALPELYTTNLFTSSRSRATTDTSVQSSNDSSRTESSDASDRSSSPPNDTAPPQSTATNSTAAISAHPTPTVEATPPQPSLPPLSLTPLVQPTPLATQPPAAMPPALLQRTPSTLRMSEDEYLRGMEVNKSQRLSLEVDAEDKDGGTAMGELRERLDSGWAAQYDIVVRPKTALLLTQLATSSAMSTPPRGPLQLSATVPHTMRSLRLGLPSSPLLAGEVNDLRSLLRPVVPFALDVSRAQMPPQSQARAVVAVSVAALNSSTGSNAAAGSTSRSSTPPMPTTLAPISQPPTTTTTAAPRSLSLFARHPPTASPSASPPVRPSMEMTLQARRSISLEPLSAVDGRERQDTGTSLDEEMDEVSTAMLEEETEKLLSFVRTASDGAANEGTLHMVS